MNAQKVVTLYALGAKNDVFSVFQRLTLGEGKQGVITHANGFSESFFSEILHIERQTEKKIVFFADSPLLVHGDNRFNHTATSSLLASGVA